MSIYVVGCRQQITTCLIYKMRPQPWRQTKVDMCIVISSNFGHILHHFQDIDA